MRRPMSLVLSFGLLLSSSCCSIICGPDQEVHITSEPEGARVFVDGMSRGKTPMFTNLVRKRSHTVRFELDGYEEHSEAISRGLNVWIFGNIIFGGVIGLVVDIATGSTGNLRPDRVHAVLEPASPVS